MSLYKTNYLNLKDEIQNKYNIKIIYNKVNNNFYIDKYNIISLYKYSSFKRKYYMLIHEFGHFLSIKKGNIFIENNNKSKLEFVEKINDELHAWQLGKNYLNKNNFKYNEKDFNFYKTKCIMSYIKFGLINVYNDNINIDIIKVN